MDKKLSYDKQIARWHSYSHYTVLLHVLKEAAF